MRVHTQTGNHKLLVAVVAGLTLLAGLFAYKYFAPAKSDSTSTNPATANITSPPSMVGKPRPAFVMPDIEGQSQDVAQWNGKVMLINFWATWCPPCRREIPAFIRLQETYRDKGLVIVGIALDTQQAAIDYVDPMGINYPILVGEVDGISLTQRYGNELGVLPYSVIVDRNGVIQKTFLKEVTYEDAEKLITPYL